ncbi:GAF domain-containing protein [Actinoplanes octamycinicus]|uniref:GAF domain-containing protein n=1 Tax=Actinoplanes octamycinicus TaxID=135948 RepID=A0A7W7H0A2_9ACTN|nr:GAF domain-containing protein [Actinoplanes octamycinicus]MBB4741596.1 GAF domain-containing protein [Actinoplanes octamycinicus]GIE57148.1 transcriptional regulator [Actinoplanes octamycinicus]
MGADFADDSLAGALVALAGTPDEASDLDERLARIARLAVDRVAAADFASVTTLRDGSYTTVACSGELVRAVDQIQYDDKDGPCLEALRENRAVTVPDIATSVRWPGFARVALRLGLRASVSLPLFTAGGAAVASLNLHGRDDRAMAPLIAGVWDVYDPDRDLPAGVRRPEPADDGARELLAGFAAAVAVRSRIQQALALLRERHAETMQDAYHRLVGMAAESGRSVRVAAETVLAGDL